MGFIRRLTGEGVIGPNVLQEWVELMEVSLEVGEIGKTFFRRKYWEVEAARVD